MSNRAISRRQFVNGCILTAGGLAVSKSMDSAVAAISSEAKKLHIATNVYPWMTFSPGHRNLLD